MRNRSWGSPSRTPTSTPTQHTPLPNSYHQHHSMLSYFAGKFLISLNYKGVQVYGRAFATERTARAWEQDAYDAIDSGLPLPDERLQKQGNDVTDDRSSS